MRRKMRNPRKLKVRWYAVHLIDFNEYLDAYLEQSKVIFLEMELNEILLNSVSNILIRQAYVQGFDCESIS